MVKLLIKNRVLLGAFFLFVACHSNKPEEIKLVDDQNNLANITIRDLETVITDSGCVKYRLITQELKQFDRGENSYTEFVNGLHLMTYNQKDEVDAQIKSKYAKHLDKKKIWELRNSVEAVNFKGDVINTELLFWDEVKHRIYSDQFIQITTATQIISGYGFESNEDLSVYQIRNVNGIIDIDDKK